MNNTQTENLKSSIATAVGYIGNVALNAEMDEFLLRFSGVGFKCFTLNELLINSKGLITGHFERF